MSPGIEKGQLYLNTELVYINIPCNMRDIYILHRTVIIQIAMANLAVKLLIFDYY